MFLKRAGKAVKTAILPAIHISWWVCRIMIPITLVMAVLNFTGIIQWFAGSFNPLFEVLGLPGEAALVFITSALSNLYAAVAVIATIGFEFRDATLLAVMCLICHNLIIESAIQQKTGASAWKMSILRIFMGLFSAYLLNLILPAHMPGKLLLPSMEAPPESWLQLFTGWIRTVIPLVIRLFGIITLLNIIQNLLREFKIMDMIAVPLRPLMALYGLPPSTSFLWIISNIVGLAYGGAALIEEIRQGNVSRRESKLLNTHTAISHSMLEDTMIFTSIGIGLWWLLLPRIVLAIVTVWTYRGVAEMAQKYRIFVKFTIR